MDFGEAFQGNHTLVFRAIDKYGYAGTSNVTVTFEDKSSSGTSDTITIQSPLKESAITRIYGDQFFNIRFSLTPGQDEITHVNLYMDGKLAKILPVDMEQTVAINEEKDLSIGKHIAEIETIDAKSQKTRKSVPFEVMAR